MDLIFGLFGAGIAIFIALAILSIPVLLLSKVITHFLARSITPSAHKRYGDIEDTEGDKSLRADGFSVTVDSSYDAVASLMKARSK